MLIFVDGRFINDSDKFGKMFVAVWHWHMPFKKTNKMQLPSNSVFSADIYLALDFEPWRGKLVQPCAICACIRKHNILQFIY